MGRNVITVDAPIGQAHLHRLRVTIAKLNAGELSVDIYGDGGTVGVLEEEVRALVGKPAAVFMPSGTMIQ